MIKDSYEFIFSLYEDSERFEEIRQHSKYSLSKEFTQQERQSFYNCYKKVLQARRTVWHPVYVLEKKEIGKQRVIAWYRKKLESEMEEVCREVFAVADFQIKVSKNLEHKAFFYKMKGDYCRYQAEYQTISENADLYGVTAVQNAFYSYEQASEIALTEFPPSNILRLSLALNFSVFFYEIIRSVDRALLLARMAYQDGINDLNSVDGQSKKETEKLLAMINENIVLWSSETQFSSN
jgi:14-3-3 protein epsilon